MQYHKKLSLGICLLIFWLNILTVTSVEDQYVVVADDVDETYTATYSGSWSSEWGIAKTHEFYPTKSIANSFQDIDITKQFNYTEDGVRILAGNMTTDAKNFQYTNITDESYFKRSSLLDEHRNLLTWYATNETKGDATINANLSTIQMQINMTSIDANFTGMWMYTHEYDTIFTPNTHLSSYYNTSRFIIWFNNDSENELALKKKPFVNSNQYDWIYNGVNITDINESKWYFLLFNCTDRQNIDFQIFDEYYDLVNETTIILSEDLNLIDCYAFLDVDEEINGDYPDFPMYSFDGLVFGEYDDVWLQYDLPTKNLFDPNFLPDITSTYAFLIFEATFLPRENITLKIRNPVRAGPAVVHRESFEMVFTQNGSNLSVTVGNSTFEIENATLKHEYRIIWDNLNYTVSQTQLYVDNELMASFDSTNVITDDDDIYLIAIQTENLIHKEYDITSVYLAYVVSGTLPPPGIPEGEVSIWLYIIIIVVIVGVVVGLFLFFRSRKNRAECFQNGINICNFFGQKYESSAKNTENMPNINPPPPQ